MYSDHLVRDEDLANKEQSPNCERGISPYPHLRRYRVWILLVLALFGLHQLVARSGAGNGQALTAQHAAPARAPIQTAQASAPGAPLTIGMGAGTSSGERTGATLPAASCNPFDVICWLTNAAQWIGQQIINALQSVINGLLHGPLDIITQTPPADTNQNGTVIPWANAFLAVVDLALPEFLPRLLLAFGAAHFSLFFLGLFIDLENALSGVVLDLASHSMLTKVLSTCS